MKTIILEDWQVKNLREYFGQNDATQTSHWAFPIFDKAHKEAINHTHCCKSDSDQLLFTQEEIVARINEQTVLDGETFRNYFDKK